ncbi:peptidoglycan-binding domain-containing protein [Chitinophaga sp. 22321]|uniref:Peptidoglycan-binding protein n=1 Tax=Chitinophaga hostae TaxID=2831022 RepID=A0ABS5IX01_9BACT|nr:peptidoglycan-binding domain-containing protein [Chitinophaga hostae]MBS0027488.1 peptidoglycan-binding protein [Chitinophaga hostae]
MSKDKFGFQNLAKKSLAVIAAALSAFSQTKAEVFVNNLASDNDNNINYENIHKNVTKPKLVLKLNVANPENSFVLMHSSHSSHRSHSSHSSHSSHYSSSYSSGSSYTPAARSSYTQPSPSDNSSSSESPLKTSSITNTAGRNSGVSTGNSFYNRNTASSPTSNKLGNLSAIADSQHLKLGDRQLSKGCEGADVEMLQKILMTFKKDMYVTGYFGLQTEIIIIKFQQDNELRPNGIVDSKTLHALINKINGNSPK